MALLVPSSHKVAPRLYLTTVRGVQFCKESLASVCHSRGVCVWGAGWGGHCISFHSFPQTPHELLRRSESSTSSVFRPDLAPGPFFKSLHRYHLTMALARSFLHHLPTSSLSFRVEFPLPIFTNPGRLGCWYDAI